MPTTVQRQRKKSMPLRKSQRRNPQQRILNQSLWLMPSENHLMMTKTQEKIFLVEYQEETPLEIQDIQLEAGMPQDTANKNLCQHTQDAQKFLVTPTKGMAYIHGTATKVTVCIDNAQHPMIIDSRAHFSIVSRNYLDNHFLNWESQLLPTKAKNFKSASGKITSIWTIIKDLIEPHRKVNIRLNPELIVLDNAHI
ncbi:hypothetical protein O181_039145 [Austropuccinia psidii MF-1]|uniref:Uncharacterized protein n=1 Tax=Austropuccinia psidii MF-1 TaxID=1389203 RepID=A0A9Q3DEB4_9BASI|nr:hypothetical protein [Austropuccinia psidii MF-1]